jgi:diamine N-acetyltransferase
MLKNEKIILRPISIKDTHFILELRNNSEIADQFFSDEPVYDFEHNEWLSSRNKDDLDFIIVENDTQKEVGRIYLTNINYRHQKGEYGIVLHSDFRGKRIASDASHLLLEYVFNNLPINKIYLEVFESNTKAIHLYEKIGFQKEGVFKEEYFKNGTFQNVCRMSLLREDYKNEGETQ